MLLGQVVVLVICLLVATPLLDLVIPSTVGSDPATDIEAMADCLNAVRSDPTRSDPTRSDPPAFLEVSRTFALRSSQHHQCPSLTPCSTSTV
jgi:hypothetical protein